MGADGRRDSSNNCVSIVDRRFTAKSRSEARSKPIGEKGMFSPALAIKLPVNLGVVRRVIKRFLAATARPPHYDYVAAATFGETGRRAQERRPENN